MKLKHYLSKYGVRLLVAAVLITAIVLTTVGLRGGRAGLLKNADGTLKAPVQKAAAAIL